MICGSRSNPRSSRSAASPKVPLLFKSNALVQFSGGARVVLSEAKPEALLTVRARSVACIVSPSTPTKAADPMVAFTPIQLRSSTIVAPVIFFGFTMTSARFALSTLNPTAPASSISVLPVSPVLNAPPTPINRCTSVSAISITDASFRSRDVVTVVGSLNPSPFTSTFIERFSIVNVPRASTKPETSRATVPDALSSKLDVNLPFGSVLNTGKSPVLLSNAFVQSRRAVVARPAASLALFTCTSKLVASNIKTSSRPTSPAKPIVSSKPR